MSNILNIPENTIQMDENDTSLNSYIIILNPNLKISENQSLYLQNVHNDDNTILPVKIDPLWNQQISTINSDECYKEVHITNNQELCEVIQYEDIIVESHSPTEELESLENINEDNVNINPTLTDEKKIFTCNWLDCGKQYTTQNNLLTHSRTHCGIKPFCCNVCNREFNTSYALKVHTRIHTGDKPYKCSIDECGKAFKTSGDLTKHFRTHTGFRPFKCTFDGCNRWFTTATILKVHTRTHTGERPYKCSYAGCNKSFTRLTNVNDHERIHSGEKPYQCNVCHKRFTVYSSLFKHKAVHQSSRLIDCPICEKQYKKDSSLRMHIERAHPEHVIEKASNIKQIKNGKSTS